MSSRVWLVCRQWPKLHGRPLGNNGSLYPFCQCFVRGCITDAQQHHRYDSNHHYDKHHLIFHHIELIVHQGYISAAADRKTQRSHSFAG